MNRVLEIREEYLNEEDAETICDDFDIQYFHEDDDYRIYIYEENNPDGRYDEARLRFSYATISETDIDSDDPDLGMPWCS